MAFEDFNEDMGYTTNLEKIVTDTNYLPIVRNTAARLIEQPYETIGYWLQNISDSDLGDLLHIVEEQQDAYDQDEDAIVDEYDNILLLAMMLSQSEGVDMDDFDTVHETTNIFAILLTTEGLARKGFVKIKYDKLSFGSEFRDIVVAEKTDLFDDYMNGDEE